MSHGPSNKYLYYAHTYTLPGIIRKVCLITSDITKVRLFTIVLWLTRSRIFTTVLKVKSPMTLYLDSSFKTGNLATNIRQMTRNPSDGSTDVQSSDIFIWKVSAEWIWKKIMHLSSGEKCRIKILSSKYQKDCIESEAWNN